MTIKAFYLRLTSTSNKGSTPHQNATATSLFDESASLQKKASHVPCEEERKSSPNDRFSSGNFGIFTKAIASRTRRFVRSAKSWLSCISPKRHMRGMEKDAPVQPDIPEFDKSSSEFNGSAKGATIEEEILQEKLSLSLSSSDPEHEIAGQTSVMECEVVEQDLSEEDSEEVLIAIREEEPYRYYHQLPCEEGKPILENGTVSRLSLMFESLQTDALSSEKFIKRISSAAGCDGDKTLGRKEGEARDRNFDNAEVHAIETSQGGSREILKENTASSTSAEHEEEQRSSDVPGEVDQEKSANVYERSHVPPQKVLRNSSGLEMPCESGIGSPASSTASAGTIINTPSDNDMIAGVEEECLEDRQENEECDRRPSRVVAFHKTVNFSEKGRKDDSEDVDVMSRQVSFRSDEDYCTPIIEFELKDIGCGLQ